MTDSIHAITISSIQSGDSFRRLEQLCDEAQGCSSPWALELSQTQRLIELAMCVCDAVHSFQDDHSEASKWQTE